MDALCAAAAPRSDSRSPFRGSLSDRIVAIPGHVFRAPDDSRRYALTTGRSAHEVVNRADLLVCLIHQGREKPEAAWTRVPLPHR